MRRTRMIDRWTCLVGVAALAVLLAGCGGGSSDPQPPPPPVIDAPVIQSLLPGDGLAMVHWSFVPGVDGYNVYWSGGGVFDPDNAYSALGVVDLDYLIAGLDPAGICTVRVAAYIGATEGPLSEPVSVTLPPGAPSLVSATATETGIVIDWDEVAGATSYDLYRSTTPDVAIGNGERFTDVMAPYNDDVAPETMYYYIVVPIGPGGTGRASAVVAAEVEVILEAPLNLTVAVPEEAPGALLISWDPPAEGVPDSYNLYFSTVPGVTTADSVIEGAVSPYLHAGLLGRTTYYYRVAGVVEGFVGPLSAEASGMPRGSPQGGGGGGSGGHDEGYGNNLALPLVFAEGYGLGGAMITGTTWEDFATGLRPLSTEGVLALPVLDEATAHDVNGTLVYPQQSPSTWQAEWRNGKDALQDVIVDWGDNLRSARITTKSVVRVETVLYRDDPDDPMLAVAMEPLGGTGADELWGSPDGAATVESARRHVFALTGRLTLTKLLGEGGEPDPGVAPLSISVAEGLAAEEGHLVAVGGGGGGGGGGGAPLRFGLEINVSGKGVYGFVWMLTKSGIPEASRVGWWKATFSLDATADVGGTAVANNTRLLGTDPSDPAAVLDSETSCSLEFLVEE